MFMNEVEVGQRYEVALTTLSGFYRYRMGDVIEVVGHHEKCPLVTVKYRLVNHYSSDCFYQNAAIGDLRTLGGSRLTTNLSSLV